MRKDTEIFFPQSLPYPGKFKIVLETLIKECPCENEEKGVAIFISEGKEPRSLSFALQNYCVTVTCHLLFTIFQVLILSSCFANH